MVIAVMLTDALKLVSRHCAFHLHVLHCQMLLIPKFDVQLQLQTKLNAHHAIMNVNI